jgi:hypothetical protein
MTLAHSLKPAVARKSAEWAVSLGDGDDQVLELMGQGLSDGLRDGRPGLTGEALGQQSCESRYVGCGANILTRDWMNPACRWEITPADRPGMLKLA